MDKLDVQGVFTWASYFKCFTLVLTTHKSYTIMNLTHLASFQAIEFVDQRSISKMLEIV